MNAVKQTWLLPNGTTAAAPLASFASFLCPALDASCGPLWQANLAVGDATWTANPAYNSQMMPIYQLQVRAGRQGWHPAVLSGGGWPPLPALLLHARARARDAPPSPLRRLAT